ncbi:hypothetical protein BGZ79_005289 [Entomortierella chlamydospora]|nr:hypothetical protein BGZ79_005289 [Entomortierella chlamydospora]
MHSIIDSPLEIPLIRRLVSEYVSKEDAVACACVCRDWRDDFTRSVWHTIDFDIHGDFVHVARDVVSKLGRHIRVIKKITESYQLDAINNPSICMLESLDITVDPTTHSQAHCYDILRRNNTSLINLDVSLTNIGQNPGIFSVDVLKPARPDVHESKITDLTFHGIAMTRDTLSSLLRMSPFLKVLDIQESTLLTSMASDIYQHPKVETLYASIEQVFRFDDQPHGALPLIAHFPNLTSWEIYPSARKVPSRIVKAEISRCCRKLSQFLLELSSSEVIEFLSHGVRNVVTLRVLNPSLSHEVIQAILHHQETLEEIGTLVPNRLKLESSEPFEVGGQCAVLRRSIQMIPCVCAKLKDFRMVQQEIDMDEVEKTEWVCIDLKSLRIRIRGLDTKDKINRAIELWVQGRKNGSTIQDFQGSKSIEERVARHLLKFDRLEAVWLGTSTKHVQNKH